MFWTAFLPTLSVVSSVMLCIKVPMLAHCGSLVVPSPETPPVPQQLGWAGQVRMRCCVRAPRLLRNPRAPPGPLLAGSPSLTSLGWSREEGQHCAMEGNWGGISRQGLAFPRAHQCYPPPCQMIFPASDGCSPCGHSCTESHLCGVHVSLGLMPLWG